MFESESVVIMIRILNMTLANKAKSVTNSAKFTNLSATFRFILIVIVNTIKAKKIVSNTT